jgi:hypothetical protein
MSMIFDDARDAGDALRIAKAALQRSISHSAATEPSLYSYRDRICTLTEIIQAAKHVATGLARRTDELAPSVAEADEEHVRNLRKALGAASAQAEQAALSLKQAYDELLQLKSR